MTTQLKTLEDLYIDELRDLYHAEKELAKALPEMAKSSRSPELSHAFERDVQTTNQHVERLERIFQGLGQEPTGHRCKGMEGLLQEGRDRIHTDVKPEVLDAGLVVLAQKAQHYEMAGYGSACTFAKLLKRDEDAKILEQTLKEEKLADAEFTQLAFQSINQEAATTS